MNTYDYRQFDPLVHSRIRLSVLAILVSVDDAEFTCLRDQVRATDGNLGAHLRKLENGGYVQVTKHFANRKPHTRYRVTQAGRDAFRKYVDNLERLLHAAPKDLEGKAAG